MTPPPSEPESAAESAPPPPSGVELMVESLAESGTAPSSGEEVGLLPQPMAAMPKAPVTATTPAKTGTRRLSCFMIPPQSAALWDDNVVL